MADTTDAWPIGKAWTDLNTLTGIAVGTEIILQCVGQRSDEVEVATSTTEPLESFVGVKCQYGNPDRHVPAGESRVWVRFFRLGNPNAGTTTKLQVQTSGAISQYQSGAPSNSYNVDLALGLIEGQSSAAKVCFNPDLGEAFEDLWPLGGSYAGLQR